MKEENTKQQHIKDSTHYSGKSNRIFKRLFLVMFILFLSLVFASCNLIRGWFGGNTRDIYSWSQIVELINRDLKIDVDSTLKPNIIEYYYFGYLDDDPNSIVIGFDANETACNSYINLLVSKGLYNFRNSGEFYSVDETYSITVYTQYSNIVFSAITQKEVHTTSANSINAYNKEVFGFSGLPTTGTFNVLLVPVDFTNRRYTSSELTKLDLAYNGNAQSTGYESVSSYYFKSSYGQLELTFDIAETFHTTHTSFHYEIGQYGDERVIGEYINSTPDVNFEDYDTDSDGRVDAIVFVYANQYDYETSPWWAWCKVLNIEINPNLLVGNIQWVSYNFIENSFSGFNPSINAQTYIHETGHLLGADDYYNGVNYGPLGGYDMMDSNIGDHNPFTKMLYGWISPDPFTFNSPVTLGDYSTSGDFLVIPYDEEFSLFSEYLVIVNYHQSGLYESFKYTQYATIPEGLIVYHVDARLQKNPLHPYLVFLNQNINNLRHHQIEILSATPGLNIASSGLKFNNFFHRGLSNLSFEWNQGGSINLSINIDYLYIENEISVVLTKI